MLKTDKKSYTDVELVNGCALGSELHFRILYERYYGKMLNVCKRYASSYEESRDMMQEGFIRVFKCIHQYRSDGSFEGWMRRIVVTTCINYYRKYGAKMMGENDQSRYVVSMNMEATSSSYDSTPSTSKYDAEFLLRQIQNLPATYRMVFNLFAIEGYSHAEIAEKLNITESTSRANLSKARQKLKQNIDQVEKANSIYHG